jgi:hypothetical protein
MRWTREAQQAAGAGPIPLVALDVELFEWVGGGPIRK